MLFAIINNQKDQESETKQEQMKKCCEWMLKCNDNILQALLTHQQDLLTLDYMGYYGQFRDQSLFVHSLDKNSYTFIQESLLKGAFDKHIFKKEEVVQKILEFMKIGSKTNFLLNTLLLTDISEWKDKYLQKLISMFKELIEEKYENNRLLLSYNPLMSIALSAELLTKISKERVRFANVCRGLKNELLELGK